MPKLKNPPQLKVSTFNTCSEADYKLYKEYCISNKKEPVSYTKYKKIVLVSNEILSDKILNGARVKLHNKHTFPPIDHLRGTVLNCTRTLPC